MPWNIRGIWGLGGTGFEKRVRLSKYTKCSTRNIYLFISKGSSSSTKTHFSIFYVRWFHQKNVFDLKKYFLEHFKNFFLKKKYFLSKDALLVIGRFVMVIFELENLVKFDQTDFVGVLKTLKNENYFDFSNGSDLPGSYLPWRTFTNYHASNLQWVKFTISQFSQWKPELC